MKICSQCQHRCPNRKGSRARCKFTLNRPPAPWSWFQIQNFKLPVSCNSITSLGTTERSCSFLLCILKTADFVCLIPCFTCLCSTDEAHFRFPMCWDNFIGEEQLQVDRPTNYNTRVQLLHEDNRDEPNNWRFQPRCCENNVVLTTLKKMLLFSHHARTMFCLFLFFFPLNQEKNSKGLREVLFLSFQETAALETNCIACRTPPK